MRILLEICVDDPLGLAEAQAGGADRVEPCAALALARPGSGDFCFFLWELAALRAALDD